MRDYDETAPLERARASEGKPERQLSEGAVLLAALGKPRATVAEACGVSGPAVSQWKSGATVPRDPQRAILWSRWRIPVESWDRDAPEPEPLVKGAPAPSGPFSVGDSVAQLQDTVTRILGSLEQGGTSYDQSRIASQCAATLAQLRKLQGEDPITLKRIWKSEAWAKIVAAHRRALASFPAAAEALGKELRELDEEV